MAAKPEVLAPDNWQAQSDLRTLIDAHKIRNDKKRHQAAKLHAKSQLAAMKGVMDAEDRKDGGIDEATEKNP